MKASNPELETLLARCALRDAKALERLYSLTSAYFNAVCWRILKNEAACHDALQEAYIQIWHNADRYRPHLAQPLTWMCSIVRYRALDKLEGEKRYHAFADLEEESLVNTLLDEHGNSSEECFGDQDELDHCLNKLDERHQTCVKLAYIYGYSRDELAAKLNTKVNTIKSWLHRASKQLKDCLNGDFNYE